MRVRGVNGENMEFPKDYLEKKKQKKSSLHSAVHVLADEIWQASPKLKGDFGFILGRIKAVGGHQLAYARWQESKKKSDPFKYFIAKY